MRRIMIIGGPGSGKSTLARQIGARLDLPVIHLDQIYWKPGWVFQSYHAVADRLEALYRMDAWVIEGNYSDSWPQRLARADTVIFLDVPTGLRFWRVLRRSVLTHGQVRADMAKGCPEQIDFGFYRYVLGYRHRRRLKALQLLRDAPPEVNIHQLQGVRDARHFLATISAGDRPRAAKERGPG